MARDQRGGTPVLLDQRDDAGAARPGLEPDRAGAGVQVEEAQAGSEPHHDSMAEKSASRTRSLVGRVLAPRGVAIRRPPAVPR